MRPVNLIPSDGRRGRRAIGAPATRTGAAVYVVLGALAFGVIAVATLVVTSNKINDRKESIAALEQEEKSAKTAADALRPYGNFAQMQQARVTTIQSLAESSFNWERILRSLSRTIPSNAWLVTFKGTVRPDVDVASGASGGTSSVSGLRGDNPSPAIELVGCTYTHGAVARMMTRMRNLDGVTEVVLGSSERPEALTQGAEAGGGADAPSGGGGSDEDCRTKYGITKFEILVVFGELRATEPSAPATPLSPTPVASAQGATATANSRSAAGAGATP